MNLLRSLVIAPVVLVAVVVAISAVEAGQKVQQPTGLTVIDSQGKTIGVYYAQEGESDSVIIKVGESYFKAEVTAAGFRQHYHFFFTELNCQGQLFVSPSQTVVPRMMVSGTSGYYLLPSDATSSVTVNSAMSSDYLSPCMNNSAPGNGQGAIPRTVDLSVFVPPFSVK